MISIKELRTIDIPFYGEIFNIVKDLFDTYAGTYYKLDIDGKEYILHRLEQYFTLFTKEGKVYDAQSFTVDEDYNIIGLAIDNKIFYYVDGHLVSKDKDNGIIESISLVKRNNGEDYDGYDGFVQHVQYDAKSDLRFIQTYQHMYNPGERIYDMHLKNPFSIVIEEHASKTDIGEAKSKSTKYIKCEYDLREDPVGFGIATIKDYGLSKFLSNGSYSLQKQDTIVRYYKILRVLNNGGAVTLYPLCRQYRKEDIYEAIDKYGFSKTVSELLLDVYNNEYPLLKMYQDITKSIKEVELSDEIVTLELTMEDDNNGSS